MTRSASKTVPVFVRIKRDHDAVGAGPMMMKQHQTGCAKTVRGLILANAVLTRYQQKIHGAF